MCIARSRWASDPGSCMPVSTRTMPSPAASAQALQCGTPGHGSGSRSRQTPGSTRSPRPTSRLRLASGIARQIRVARMAITRKARTEAAISDAERLSRRYFEALDAHDVESAVACWAAGARDVLHGMMNEAAPDGVRAFVTGVLPARPDARFGVLSAPAAGGGRA